MAVLYRHLKPCGEVFYIGIGKESRAYEKYGRNEFWKRVVKKYSNYEIQILKSDLTVEEAQELEIILIAWYGRRDLGLGTLVNLTDGGEGVVNLSEEAYLKGLMKRVGTSSKSVICLDTGKIWWSISSCEKELNIGARNLNNLLLNKGKTTSIKYNLQFLDDYINGVPYIKKGHTEYPKGADHSGAKKVINIKTLIIYNSISEAAIASGINRRTLNKKLIGSLRNNTDYIFYDRYINNETMSQDITPRDIVFLCVNTNQEYSNLSKYCRDNNIKYHIVNTRLKKWGVYEDNERKLIKK